MKKAIVVGATSGIGREVARLLAAQGWRVGIAGRRTEHLTELMATEANIVAYETIDVNSEEACEHLESLINKLGGMNLYFHSSGIGWQNIQLDHDKELATAETNVLGFTRMVTFAYNYFAAQTSTTSHEANATDEEANQLYGSHIACITSIAGTKGLGAAPSYSATKAYQQHYLESLHQLATIRHLPITITDIRPGFVATDLIAGSNFPLQLRAEDVARSIVDAINRKASVLTIDWRYRLLVGLWRIVPRWLWVRMKIASR